MPAKTCETANTEVKAVLIKDPKILDIEMIQIRFSGQLNVVNLKSGYTAIYPEPWMQQEFDEFTALCMTLQVQMLDLRRSA